MPRPIHVLHFEDDPADAARFRDYLVQSKRDYRIDAVECLSDGLNLLKTAARDIILLDLGLPDCKGIECFRRVRSFVLDIPILVLGEKRDDRLAKKTVHEGAQDYLIKDDINQQALVRSVDYAIERSMAEKRIAHLNRLLRSIREINRLIVREKDKDTLLKKACEIICEVSGYRFAWIGLVEPGHTRVIPTAHAGFEEGYLTAVTMTWDNGPTGRGPTGTAIRKRKTVVREDLIRDSEDGPWSKESTARGYRASLAAPLFHDKTVYGALNVYSDKPGFFDKEEVLLLSEIARDIALALFMIKSEQKRKMAEQEAVYLKEYNESIINAMPDPIDIVDRAMTLVFQNRASRDKFGNGIDKKCHDFYHGSGKPCGHCTAVNALKEKKTYSRDVLIKDGLHAEVVSSPILMPDGRLCCMEIIRDITDRKRAEEELSRSNDALRETEKIQKAILDNIPDIAWLKDKECRFIAVNEPFARMCGFTSKDLVGKTDLDVWPVELAGRYMTDDREVMRSGAAKTVEEPLTDVEGKTRWIETIKTPIYGNRGEVIGTTGIARDITERRQIEEQLREQADILDQIHDIVITTDLQGTITSWSRGAERQMGYRADEMLGRPIELIYPESDYEATKKRMIDGLRGNGEIRNEFTIKRKDGTEFPVHLTLTLRKDTGGKTVGIIGSAVDITERKKAEEALKASEEKYRLVVENGNEAIVVAQDNILKFVNPQTEVLSGYSREELLGKPFTEFIYSEDRGGVLKHYQKRLTGETAIYPERFRITHRNGEPRWAETRVVIIDWEGRPATLVFFHDITEQRLAEEARRESEKKYRDLFERSKDTVFMATVDGRIVAINPAGSELFGYTEEEIKDINVAEFYVNPDDRARFRQQIEQQGYTKDFEITYRKKDGTFLDCLETATVARDRKGRIVGYQGTIRDVTEHKKMEKRLVQAEKLSSIGGMISGVAHELNNPLTSIIGNAQLLMRKEIPHDFRNKLEVIQRESVRCTRIVGGLLSFAREHRPQRRMIDINTVLMESLKLREYDLKVNNIQMGTNLADDIPETSADPFQLQQVFINLINNSHDALRDKGGGTLSIRSFSKDNSI
ncbi:MAG: PAS domain S-box protein, partial [Deltaproteobacteria bacterium]|nr:PAS domain S-box protein [Candidatus Zymogenaceae bacterium]